jgi:hypothetical protein
MQLVDLLAIPDPSGIGGEMKFFPLPFYTIESVHVVDERTLLVAADNNFPFSNGDREAGAAIGKDRRQRTTPRSSHPPRRTVRR